jgi:hypothetical protein
MEELHRVEIRKGEIYCEVVPGDLFALPGQTVSFANGTGDVVRVFFGGRDLFDTNMIEIPKDRSVELTLRKDLARRKSYHYAVYCEVRHAFAVGGSNPRIIIME